MDDRFAVRRRYDDYSSDGSVRTYYVVIDRHEKNKVVFTSDKLDTAKAKAYTLNHGV